MFRREFTAIYGATGLGPDTEKYDSDFYCCWRLMTAGENTVSDYGTEILRGTKYYQRYIIFTTTTGLNKKLETRRLTEKEYFLWKLQGKDTEDRQAYEQK
jgi:hypothetical protein